VTTPIYFKFILKLFFPSLLCPDWDTRLTVSRKKKGFWCHYISQNHWTRLLYLVNTRPNISKLSLCSKAKYL